MSDGKDKIQILEACHYDDLAKHTKVINLDAAEYYAWIQLDPDDVRNSYFFGVQEIGISANNSMIFGDTFTRESECWIRMNMTHVARKPGKHTFKLSFVDRTTDDPFSLYCSFHLQVDNPEKPYVYMHQEEVSEQRLPIIPDGPLTPYMTEEVK